MKVPVLLNDLDKAIMAFQRRQAALPDLLRHLCAGNLWLLVPECFCPPRFRRGHPPVK